MSDDEIDGYGVADSGKSFDVMYQEVLSATENIECDTSDTPIAKIRKLASVPNNNNHSRSSLYQEYQIRVSNDCYKVKHHARYTTYFPRERKEEVKYIYCVEPDINMSNCYDMTKFPRGIITIFNMQDFEKLAKREGTNVDAEQLVLLFLELGFIVERYDNYSKEEMMLALHRAASEDFTNMSCWMCAVLSHGDKDEKDGEVIFAVDDKVKISEITYDLFDEKDRAHLIGKPKIFILNACRGSQAMNPIDADSTDTCTEDTSDSPLYSRSSIYFPAEKQMALTLPYEADFLYAYSTVSDYVSILNHPYGSWFIQDICSVFRENAHLIDLTRMFTRVNNRIANRKGKSRMDERINKKKQIASVISQLRNDLYFLPPYGPLNKQQEK